MVLRFGASLFSRLQHAEQEVCIRVLDRDSVKLRITRGTKAAEIKRRLASATGVLAQDQCIVFCGRVLRDEDPLPEDAFAEGCDVEPVLREPELPALTVWMIEMKAPVVEADWKTPRSGTATSRGGQQDTDDDGFDSARDSTFSVKSGEEEEDGRYRIWRSKQQMRFDLTEELTKIQCDQYAPLLRQLGYFTQGAFSKLTDHILQKNPLFVHRRARQRILALAEVHKRKIYDEIALRESSLAELRGGGPLLNDGNEFFRSKAQLRKAWASKRMRNADEQSTARSERSDTTSAVPQKQIPDNILKKMERIRARIPEGGDDDLDEDDDDHHHHPKRVQPNRPAIYCCAKHERWCRAKSSEHIEQQKQRHISWFKLRLQSYLNPLEGTRPLATLKRVAAELFVEAGVSIPNKQLDELLSRCKVDDQGWEGSVFDLETPPVAAHIIYAHHHLRWDRFLPMPAYWEDQFIELLTTAIADKERHLLFHGQMEEECDDDEERIASPSFASSHENHEDKQRQLLTHQQQTN